MAMTPEQRAALACSLGHFILDQIPYGADIDFPTLTLPSPTVPEVSIPPGYKATTGPIDRDGLYVENTASNPRIPVGFPSNGDLVDYDMMHDGKLKHWEMKATHHQMTKQLRIWYTYVQTNSEGQSRVRGTWLMIGYSGDGH